MISTPISSWLARLRKAGVNLQLENNEVHVLPGAAATPELIETLEENAEEILLYLNAKAVHRPERISRSDELAVPSLGQCQWWHWLSASEQCRDYPELIVPLKIVINSVTASQAAAAIREQVKHHDALRYRFYSDEEKPKVTINEVEDFQVELCDRSTSSQPDEDIMASCYSAITSLPLSMSERWLVRASVVTLPGYRVAILVAMHHLITDAHSILLLEGGIRASLSADGESLPSTTVTAYRYSDYAHWERRWFNLNGLPLVHYWAGKVKRIPTLRAPQTSKKLKWQPGRKTRHRISFPPHVATLARLQAKAYRTTPLVIYLSVLALVVGRWSGQMHFAIRSIADGRAQQLSLRPIVGLMTTSDTIEVRLLRDSNFGEVVELVELEYRSSFSMRLPVIHAFPPFCAAPTSSDALPDNNIAINVNYLPNMRSKNALVPPDLDSEMEPKISHFSSDEKMFSVSPTNVFIKELETALEVDLMLHDDLLTEAEQEGLIACFIEGIRDYIHSDGAFKLRSGHF